MKYIEKYPNLKKKIKYQKGGRGVVVAPSEYNNDDNYYNNNNNNDNIEREIYEAMEYLDLFKFKVQILVNNLPNTLNFSWMNGKRFNWEIFPENTLQFINGIWIKCPNVNDPNNSCYIYLFNIVYKEIPLVLGFSATYMEKFRTHEILLDEIKIGHFSDSLYARLAENQWGIAPLPNRIYLEPMSENDTVLDFIKKNFPTLELKKNINNKCQPKIFSSIVVPKYNLPLFDLTNQIYKLAGLYIEKYYYVETTQCGKECCFHLLFVLKNIFSNQEYAVLYLGKRGTGIELQSALEWNGIDNYKSFGFKEDTQIATGISYEGGLDAPPPWTN